MAVLVVALPWINMELLILTMIHGSDVVSYCSVPKKLVDDTRMCLA
jgi:hypothetical protein